MGHDEDIVTQIIISPDSRWAATGSRDGTVIIWDLDSGCISQEWFAEDTGVHSLAFSPDSQCIMSIGGIEVAGKGEWHRVPPGMLQVAACSWNHLGVLHGKGKVLRPCRSPRNVEMHAVWATVWDVHQSDRKIRSLNGEACDSILDPLSDRPRNCVWSPDGTWIAAGAPMGGKVHIWETTTFQLLHTWEGSELLAFSADGCWVVTATPQTSPKPDPTRPTTAWVWVVQ